MLVVSPGLHDCYHEPEALEHHARQLWLLAHHLSLLEQTVVWVDMNPISKGVADKATLKCCFYLNSVAHHLAAEFGFLLFSRQAMIVSGHQMNDANEYPMHQTDETVNVEVQHMMAWLSCVL